MDIHLINHGQGNLTLISWTKPTRYCSTLATSTHVCGISNYNFFKFIYTLYKIIGVSLQIFYSIICDWLEPPKSLENPQPKRAAIKPQMEKSEIVFLFQVMPQNSLTICAEGGEFDPLLEVVCLHTHPLIGGEFVLTQSPINNSDEGLGTNCRQFTVYYNMELLDVLQHWFPPATTKARMTSMQGKRSVRSNY